MGTTRRAASSGGEGVCSAFEQGGVGLQQEELDRLMQFYAHCYDYHGLKLADVRRIWSEVFEHYKALKSLHLFSDI